MFGYVTVCEPELKVKDLKKYRAYYCGLCRTLKEDYGFMGQMTLTYDMTFAVILLSSLYETIAKHEEHRCKVHPVKRQHMLRNEITSYAAAMNVLLAYYHMEDDWTDDRKVSSLMTKSLIQGKAKKIIEKYPRQSEIIRKSLKELGECEREKSMDIDRAAGCFGRPGMVITFPVRASIAEHTAGRETAVWLLTYWLTRKTLSLFPMSLHIKTALR